MSIENVTLNLSNSIKTHKFRVAEVNKMIKFLDGEIANPKAIEGKTEEEVLSVLKSSRADCDRILEILNEGYGEIKAKCESLGLERLFEVANVMSEII